MYEITQEEIHRNSFEKAFTEGYSLYLDGIYDKSSIKKVEGKKNSVLYYGRVLEGNTTVQSFVEVSEKNRISTYYCSCPDVGHHLGGMCKHLIAFCFSIIKYFQDEVLEEDDLIKQIEQEKKEEKAKAQIKALEYKKRIYVEKEVANFKKLLNEYDSKQKTLYLKEKVNLMPLIYIGRKCYLSLKIGIDKMYIVKNIDELLQSIINEDEISYGKKLSFKHVLENFSQPSIALIKMLMNILSVVRTYGVRREIAINKMIIDDIFDMYRGSQVGICLENNNNGDYNVVTVYPDNYELKIILDEKNVLRFSNLNGDNQVIFGYKKKYILFDKTLYPIYNKNKELIPLVNHLLENKKIDTVDVMDLFLSYLYPRIFEYIEVDETFKKEHPMNIVSINSYFDMEDNVVELIFKYMIDGQEINENDLMNYHYNNHKIEDYFKAIRGLGFQEIVVDNEIKNYINSTSKIVDFLRSDLSGLKDYGDVFLSETLKRTKVAKMQSGHVNIGYDVDMLSVCFEDFGFSDEELYKLLNGYKNKKKFVRLSKDSIIEVDDNLLGSLNELVEDLNLDVKHLTKKVKVPLYNSFKIANNDNEYYSLVIDEKIRSIINNISDYKTKNYSICEEVKKNLRPYQIEAYNWLKILSDYKFGGVLADDMGLGKTLEMISLISSDENDEPSLIVCPKSLTFNWYNEIKKWDGNLQSEVIYGLSNERKEMINNIGTGKKIYITSYDSLRNDISRYLDKKFRYVVLDEGQFIKNIDAQKTKAVKSLNGEVRFVLTGTPIENSLSDLWSIFDFIMPGYLSTYKNFKDKYELDIASGENGEALNQLVKKITPFVLRRTKEQVLTELPEKEETVHYAFMDPYQRKIYESYLLKTRDLLNGENKMKLLSMLTRLRQICVDPSMFIDNYNGNSCKIDLCMELIESLITNNHRVLVFSQFKSVFPKFIEQLEKSNIKYFILTGDTTNEERLKMVNEFNENDEYKVFLISLKAGGTGLNLVGADTVIHLDPWWNVSAQNQATDRAHRLGQKKIVSVFKIICANTIENKVLDLQNAKKALTDKVISTNDENIINLSQDDIKYLLS